MPKLKTHKQFILELKEINPDIGILEEYHILKVLFECYLSHPLWLKSCKEDRDRDVM